MKLTEARAFINRRSDKNLGYIRLVKYDLDSKGGLLFIKLNATIAGYNTRKDHDRIKK